MISYLNMKFACLLPIQTFSRQRTCSMKRKSILMCVALKTIKMAEEKKTSFYNTEKIETPSHTIKSRFDK